MKMMTKEILNKLPKLYETENIPKEDKKVVVKFFNPCGAATWYGIEYDPESGDFFGAVNLYGNVDEIELGYFNLRELESIRLPLGLKIERDLYWDSATTLGQVKRGERS
jgi:hypothetical protein